MMIPTFSNGLRSTPRTKNLLNKVTKALPNGAEAPLETAIANTNSSPQNTTFLDFSASQTPYNPQIVIIQGNKIKNNGTTRHTNKKGCVAQYQN
jgi:hypothetical protein